MEYVAFPSKEMPNIYNALVVKGQDTRKHTSINFSGTTVQLDYNMLPSLVIVLWSFWNVE